MKPVFIAFALFGAAGGTAEAASLGATELLNQYNLITTSDVTGSSGFHIDGRALVGGNYAVDAGSVVYMNAKGAASDHAALIVAGTVGNQVHVNNGGDAVVGGGLNKLNMNGGGTKTAFGAGSAPVDFARVMSDYAGSLAAMDASASGVTRRGSIHDRSNTWDVAGIDGGVGVLSLTEADFRADRDVTFNLGAGIDWVVVNVAATVADKIFNLGSTFKAQQGLSAASHILWNFTGFEKVVFDAKFAAGAILADGAQVVTTGGNIEGSVFADSFRGLSELHFTGLADGDLPGDLPPTPPAVPLPAGMPLLLGGLAMVGLVRRRRKAA